MQVQEKAAVRAGKTHKMLPAGALIVSIIFHLAILFVFGGYVLIATSQPRHLFVCDSGQAPANVTDLPPEPQPDPVEMNPAITLQDTAPLGNLQTATAPDTEIIASTNPSAVQSFSVPPVPARRFEIAKNPGGFHVAAPAGRPSNIRFFGIHASSRRVAFLLDASGSMVIEQKGGKAGYDRLKAELCRMVENLEEDTEFNVFIFDSTVDEFKRTPVAAGDSQKKEFEGWIAPYMRDKYGNRLNNFNSERLKNFSGTTRLDLAVTGAFENGCDTVFILTDGTPSIHRPPTTAELKIIEKKRKENSATADLKFKKERETYFEKYKSLIAEMKQEVKRRNESLVGRQAEMISWIEGYKGLPPRPKADASEGKGSGGSAGGVETPNLKVGNDEILAYLQDLYQQLYKTRGLEKPRIHVVGYSVEDRDRGFLQKLATDFDGNYMDLGSETTP